jgi:hypothetical protein
MHLAHRLRHAAAAAVLVYSVVVGQSALARAPRDVWLISTRRAPWSAPADGLDALRVWRLDDDGDWASSDPQALYATDDPAVPACVFVHGNRADRHQAVRDGWAVYRALAGARPFRLVIWSWPADRIRGGHRHDVQVKARRSDVESYYLASWLRRGDPQVPRCLVGYSFGARVITGALQLCAGGRVAGRSLPESPDAPAGGTVRAVLVAAAIDNDWLLPGRRNDLALGALDRLLLTQNACDPVLKWYRLMDRSRRPEALGRTGPAGLACLQDERVKIEPLRLECSVGRNHDWCAYMRSSSLRSRLAAYALGDSPEVAATR